LRERLVMRVVRKLGEPGLDHGQPGARTHRVEREIDTGPARVVRRKPVDLPGEAEHAGFVHPLDLHVLANPLSQRIWADPPGRRSIDTSLPNQAASPSAVVSAAHAFACGYAGSMLQTIRSGKPTIPSSIAATD